MVRQHTTCARRHVCAPAGPSVGVLSTPVIELSTGNLFVGGSGEETSTAGHAVLLHCAELVLVVLTSSQYIVH